MQRSGRLKQGSVVTVLQADNGLTVNMGNTSEQVTVGAIGWSWADVPRQGLKKLSYLSAPQSKTLGFTTNLGGAGVNVSGTLAAFQRIANLGQRVRILNASPSEAGWWRITALSYNVTERDANQNEHLATVTWAMEEWVVDQSPTIGHTKVTASTASTGARNYTVKAGDTLFTIAQAQLGDGTRWAEIATLNKLTFTTSPTGGRWAAVTPGQVLKIPAR